MATVDKTPTPGHPPAVVNGPTLDPDSAASSRTPVLSFNRSRLRIQVTLTATHCQESTAPPEDLIDKVRARMREEVVAGHIAFYVVHRKRLERVWRELRALTAAAKPTAPITLTLAVGVPSLKGFSVKPSRADPQAPLTISLPPSRDDVSGWRPEWLMLRITRALKKIGASAAISPTQLHGELLRAQAGQAVTNAPLAVATTPTREGETAFRLHFNRPQREVTVTIFDVSAIADADAVAARLARLEEGIKKLRDTKRGHYVLLRDELLEAFERLRTGPESLGIDLPVTLLAAVNLTPASPQKPALTPAVSSPPRVAPAKTPLPPPPAHAQLLKLAVAPDGMRAHIAAFDPEIFSVDAAKSEEWLRSVLNAAGIVHGATTERLRAVLDKILAQEDLKDTVLAEGTAAQPAADPYYELTANDAEQGMRAYRQRRLVRAGQLVGELQWKQPGQPGKTVRGTDVLAKQGPPPDLPLAEGLRQREPGRIFAETDGVVETGEGGALVLKKILLHEGDVNMTSGDIIFAGPVEITGSVDSGVRLDVQGDLIIQGDVRGGTIRCGGNVQVAGGIVVGQAGSVRAHGDVKADFVENSSITCGGTLQVTKSILQCRIVAGIGIEVSSPSGVVASGHYQSGKHLTAPNLGLPDGAKTTVDVGAPFKTEGMVTTRQARLDKFHARHEQERKQLRELARKHPQQLSKNDKTLKKSLQERLPRWSALMEKATAHLEKAKASIVYDPNAKIAVSGLVATTCTLRLAGRGIPLLEEARSVEITTVETDGSYIHKKSA